MYVSLREWMKCMFCSILWDISTWQTPFTRRVLLTKHSCKSPHVSSLSGVRNQVQWEFVYCNFLGNKVTPYRWVNKKPRMEGATKKRKQIFCEASGAFQENCNWNVSVVKVPSPIAHLLVILVLKNFMSSSLHTFKKAIFLGWGVTLGWGRLSSHDWWEKCKQCKPTNLGDFVIPAKRWAPILVVKTCMELFWTPPIKWRKINETVSLGVISPL